MFVYTVRSSSVKFFAVLLLCLVLLVALMLSGGAVSASAEVKGGVDFTGIKTKEDRIEFLTSQGLKIDSESEEATEIIMPEDFDRVLKGYNELQRRQGLDITRYARKRVVRYTYKVMDYDDGDGADGAAPTVYANIFVFRQRIIAADVSCAEQGGFVHPVVK